MDNIEKEAKDIEELIIHFADNFSRQHTHSAERRVLEKMLVCQEARKYLKKAYKAVAIENIKIMGE